MVARGISVGYRRRANLRTVVRTRLGAQVPKRVDHQTRRDHVGSVVLKLIEQSGLAELSFRRVAAEAGLPLATLQYYFESRASLISHALAVAIEGQRKRLEQLSPRSSTGLTLVEESWCQTIPLDAVRRTESAAWFCAVVELRGSEHQELIDTGEAQLDSLAHWSVETLTGHPSPSDAAALRVFADGLALNTLLKPHQFPPEDARAHLHRYLRQLTPHETGADDSFGARGQEYEV